jgi:hypothetical protein
MRELHGYHGEHRRHARHAGDAIHGRNATADAHIGRAPDAPARDSPERTAQDALKLEMLTNPEARKAAFLKNQRKIEAAESEYAARHAKSRPDDRDRPQPEAKRPHSQHELQERSPEHAPPETRDRPASKFEQRERSPEVQREDGRKPQRRWLPHADVVKAVTDVGTFATTIAVALGGASAKWEAVAATGAAAVVSNIIWANRRRKDKDGDRPEG